MQDATVARQLDGTTSSPSAWDRVRGSFGVGVAMFAGLESIPKATALGAHSYRLSRDRNQALFSALAASARRSGQIEGTSFDLDFHVIMHFGDDVALETHYVPRRSQRTESFLTFFAQDCDTHNLVYANASCARTPLSKASSKLGRPSIAA